MKYVAAAIVAGLLLFATCSFAVRASNGGVSSDRFASIQSGMAYVDVVSILGEEGEPGPSKDWGVGARVTTYRWTAESGETLTCTFQDGRLISKDPPDSDEGFQ